MRKQFNIEEFVRLSAEGKTPKVVTYDGREVRILCTDANSDRPVVGLVTGRYEDSLQQYYSDGKVRCFDEESELYFI